MTGACDSAHNSKQFQAAFVHRDRYELNKLLVVMAWALKLPLADEVIESGLVQDFDASLSGIGQELGAGAYSMRYSLKIPQFIFSSTASFSKNEWINE